MSDETKSGLATQPPKLTDAQRRVLDVVVGHGYGLMDRVTLTHIVNANAARSLESMGLVTIDGMMVRATAAGLDVHARIR